MFVSHGGNYDVSILTFVCPHGRIVRIVRPDGGQKLLSHRPAHNRSFQDRYHRFLHGSIDILTDSTLLSIPQGRHNGEGSMHGGVYVPQGSPDPCGRATRMACDRHQTAHRLGNYIEGDAFGIRTPLTKTTDATGDDAGINLTQN